MHDKLENAGATPAQILIEVRERRNQTASTGSGRMIPGMPAYGFDSLPKSPLILECARNLAKLFANPLPNPSGSVRPDTILNWVDTSEKVVRCRKSPADETSQPPGFHLAKPEQGGSDHLTGFNLLVERLDRIESTVTAILNKQKIKDWYTTEEFAGLVGKAEFTVREWCRNGRIHGEKQGSGRGASQAWAISHAEIQRFQKEGLLPLKKP